VAMYERIYVAEKLVCTRRRFTRSILVLTVTAYSSRYCEHRQQAGAMTVQLVPVCWRRIRPQNAQQIRVRNRRVMRSNYAHMCDAVVRCIDLVALCQAPSVILLCTSRKKPCQLCRHCKSWMVLELI